MGEFVAGLTGLALADTHTSVASDSMASHLEAVLAAAKAAMLAEVSRCVCACVCVCV